MEGTKIIAGAGGGGKGGGGKTVIADDTVRSRQLATIVDVISEGPIQGLVGDTVTEKLHSISFDGTPLVNTNGSSNFKNVVCQWRSGTPDQLPLVGSGGTRNTLFVSKKAENQGTGPAIYRVINPNAKILHVAISSPGLYTRDDKGNVSGGTIAYAIYIQANNGGYVLRGDYAITEKFSSKYIRTHSFAVSGEGPWDVMLQRVSEDFNDDPGGVRTRQGDLYLENITVEVPVNLSYAHTALMGISIDAKNFGQIPVRSYLMRGIICQIPSNYDPVARTYSGTWDGTFKSGWTNNPAWVMYDILTNNRYGLGHIIPPELTDKWALYNIGVYCDQPVENGFGGKEPRFTCNLYLQGEEDAYTVVQNLASMFMSITFWGAGGIQIVQDRPSDVEAMFTNANVVNGVFNYAGSSLRGRHTVVQVSWNDPQDSYKPTIEYVQDDAAVAKWGVITNKVTAMGCTSRGQALRFGRRILYTEQHCTETVTFSTGLEGFHLYPGAVIKTSDASRIGKRMGGRLLKSNASKVNLDSAVKLEPLKQYTLSVALPDGKVQTRQVVNVGDGVARKGLNVTTPFKIEPSPEAVWLLTSNDVAEQHWRVVSMQFVEKTRVEVTAVAHHPDHYEKVERGLKFTPRAYTNIKSTPSTPNDLSVLVTSQLVAGGIKLGAVFSWASEENTFLVRYREAEGSWVERRVVDANSITLSDLQPGDYTFQVTAYSAVSIPSSTASLKHSVTPQAVKLPEPDAYRGEGRFLSDSVKVLWNASIGATSYEVKVTAGGAIRRYLDIGATLRYSYSSSDMRQDGGPWRSVTIAVRAVGEWGSASDWVELTAINPQAAAPVNVTVKGGIGSVFIDATAPTEDDIEGLIVWVSTDPTCPTTAENVKYYGVAGMVAVSGLDDSKDYYARAAFYDTFGKDNLNPSTPVKFTVYGTSKMTQEVLASPTIKALKDGVGAVDGKIAAEAAARAQAVQAEAAARTTAVQNAATKAADDLTAKAQELGAAINSEASSRATADGQLSQRIDTLTASTNGSVAALQQTQSAQATKLDAEIAARTTLAGKVATNETAITNEATARTNADTALANQTTALATRVTGAEGKITTLQSTSATKTEVTTTAQTTLQSANTYADTKATNALADAKADATTKADAVKVHANTRIDNLLTTVNNNQQASATAMTELKASFATTSGANQLPNPTFTKWSGDVPDGWRLRNGNAAAEPASVTKIVGEGISGSNAYRLSWASGATSAKGISSTALPVSWVGGEYYIVAIAARTPLGQTQGGKLRLNLSNAPAWQDVTYLYQPSLTDQWQWTVVKMRKPVGTNGAYNQIFFSVDQAAPGYPATAVDLCLPYASKGETWTGYIPPDNAQDVAATDAKITALQSVVATKDEVTASAATTLNAAKGYTDSGINSLSQVVSNNQQATSTQLDTLSSKINSIDVGGRNLLRNSANTVSNANYLFAQYPITQAPADGGNVILTVWGDIAPDRTVLLYNSNSSVQVGRADKVSTGVYRFAGKWVSARPDGSNQADNSHIRIYLAPNGSTTLNTVTKIKLEKGTVPTDWTPAPEDTDAAISDVTSNIESYKTTQATTNSALAQQTSNVQASVAGLSSTVQQQSSAIANTDGKVDALHVLRVQTAGNGKKVVAGIAMGASQTTGQGEVYVQADKFAVVNGTDVANAKAPFIVSGNTVGINGELVVNGQAIIDSLTANSIDGQKVKAGTVETSVLKSGLGGGNLVPNAAMIAGSVNQWGDATAVDWETQYISNPSSTSWVRQNYNTSYQPPNVNYLAINRNGGSGSTSSDYSYVESAPFPVLPNQYYEFAANARSVCNSTAYISLVWTLNNGSKVESYKVNIPQGNVGNNLSNYPRYFGIAQAPAGAVSAVFRFGVGGHEGTSNNMIFCMLPYVGLATGANQTVPSPWSPSGMGTQIHGGAIKTGTITANQIAADTFNGRKFTGSEFQGGAFYSGGYSAAYSWPVSGQTGMHLSSGGLLLGNGLDGKYIQLTDKGDLLAPGFSVRNGRTYIDQLDAVDTLNIKQGAIGSTGIIHFTCTNIGDGKQESVAHYWEAGVTTFTPTYSIPFTISVNTARPAGVVIYVTAKMHTQYYVGTTTTWEGQNSSTRVSTDNYATSMQGRIEVRSASGVLLASQLCEFSVIGNTMTVPVALSSVGADNLSVSSTFFKLKRREGDYVYSGGVGYMTSIAYTVIQA